MCCSTGEANLSPLTDPPELPQTYLAPTFKVKGEVCDQIGSLPSILEENQQHTQAEQGLPDPASLI